MSILKTFTRLIIIFSIFCCPVLADAPPGCELQNKLDLHTTGMFFIKNISESKVWLVESGELEQNAIVSPLDSQKWSGFVFAKNQPDFSMRCIEVFARGEQEVPCELVTQMCHYDLNKKFNISKWLVKNKAEEYLLPYIKYYE